MLTEQRRQSATRVSYVAICLALTGLFVTSCDRPTASDATKASTSPAPRVETAAGVVLRADPNPVLSGNPDGKTTIFWNTGSNDVGEVYVIAAGKETLFASGPTGSQEAPWIKPGSTEFRLYTQADHKPLAQLTVTMSSSDIPTSPRVVPTSSPSP